MLNSSTTSDKGRAGSSRTQSGYNIENKTQKSLSVPKQTVEFDKARSIRGRLRSKTFWSAYSLKRLSAGLDG